MIKDPIAWKWKGVWRHGVNKETWVWILKSFFRAGKHSSTTSLINASFPTLISSSKIDFLGWCFSLSSKSPTFLLQIVSLRFSSTFSQIFQMYLLYHGFGVLAIVFFQFYPMHILTTSCIILLPWKFYLSYSYLCWIFPPRICIHV